MNKYGRTLTDREFGKRVAAEIAKDFTFPVTLDFSGVISLGSSCGDEVLNAVSQRQSVPLLVVGANAAVRDCLQKVALDYGMSLSFKSDR